MDCIYSVIKCSMWNNLLTGNGRPSTLGGGGGVLTSAKHPVIEEKPIKIRKIHDSMINNSHFLSPLHKN